MHTRRSSSRTRLAVALLVAALTCTPALAQKKTEQLPPYDVPAMEHRSIWVQWVFAFLFVAGVVAIAVKNPHRTHLD